MLEGKILVVVPRYSNSKAPDYAYYFPIGLAYVVSAMAERNLPVSVINLNHMSGESAELLNAALDREQFSIVATGGNNLIFRELKSLITTAREHPSHPTTVLGGPLVTTDPDLAFANLCPDYGVIGEAEGMIGDLLSSLLAGERPDRIPGTIFRKNGTVVRIPPQETLAIDDLRFPALHLLGYGEWLEKAPSNIHLNALPMQNPRIYPMLGSRDCPFHCTFCFHSGKYRERSMDSIFAELEQAVLSYKINFIVFYDDCFSLKPGRVKEFCRRMTEFRQKLEWDLQYGVQFTVREFDEEMCRLLKDSGCNTVAFGFESFSPAVLSSMRKPIKPAEIDRALKLALKHHFILYAIFIFGDTAETTDSYKETLEYWKRNAEGQVKLELIRLFPGSMIYEDSLRRGIIKDKVSFMTEDMAHARPINFTEGLTDSEYQMMHLELCDARRRYMKHVVPVSLSSSGRYFRVVLKCPYCHNISDYDRFLLHSRSRFCEETVCRHCLRRFLIVSRLSQLWMYQKIIRYQLLKLLGIKNLWRFGFLFRGLEGH